MHSAILITQRSYSTMLLVKQSIHQGLLLSGPLVLRSGPLNFPAPVVDRDQTVSRRSKPSSRTFLNVEQTYPWILLLTQDKISRHRGAKQFRQCGLLGIISLLSLA